MTAPDPASLDDAQNALMLALTAAVQSEMTQDDYLFDTVFDGGQGRHERLVSFSLTTLAGVTTAFTATIRADEDEE